ncbi:MAG: AbrB/MazE/SpoVT family DNA-binding domain-containing protein, partial [Anaerolineaceae bacterium]|nr:AbrB/MazE/SpoVT family DNA-binding domain-containing protein [Anaerolineaceae bacterium]
IDRGGRLVIPANFRKALGIESGDEVVLQLKDDSIRVITIQEAVQQAQERVRKYIPSSVSLSDELIAERREEAKNE